jgi:hypothetical protein
MPELSPMMKVAIIAAGYALTIIPPTLCAAADTGGQFADLCLCGEGLHSHGETHVPVRALFDRTVLGTATTTSTATATRS